MNHTRNRCSAAVLDVCGSSCNGSCGRDTAKAGRCDITDTLSDEFRIGLVLGTDHAVCNYCRKK